MNTTIKTTTIVIALLIFFPAISFADAGQAQEQIKRSNDAITRGDYETALRLAYPLAERGNAKAQQKVGYVYDVRGDLQEAIKWYQRAADQNNDVAEHNLAVIYYNNHDALCGKQQNLFDTRTIMCGFKLNAMALALWKKAASHGNQGSKDALAAHEAMSQQSQQDVSEMNRQYEESQREALRWTFEHMK